MNNSKRTKEQLVTENKLLNEQLAELKNSNEQLKIIFDSAPDAVFVVNYEGIFLAVNNVFAEVLGSDKKSLVGKNIFELDILSESEFKKIIKGITNNVHGIKFESEEIVVEDIKGIRIYSEISFYPIKNLDDTVILGVAHDISERKKAEEKILKEQQRLSLHINQTPLGVIEWDLDFRIRKWNPSAERIFGYSEKEAIGEYGSLIIPTMSEKELKNVWYEIINIGGRSSNANIKKNGEEIFCEWYNTPLVNKEWKVIGVASLVQDISERVRAEKIQKLLFNISNAANTTENLENLIEFIKDELSKIIDTTNFYIALYNHIDDTLSLPYFADEKDNYKTFPAGKTLTKHVIETESPILLDNILMDELERQGVIETVGTDSKVWLGVPLKTEGRIIGVLAVQSYTDINAYNKDDVQMLEFVSDQISISIHRKKTEDELVKALIKAKESDKLKTAFLQNISHEIRTPMNGILGFTMLLKESGLNTDEQNEYLDIIKKSGERLLDTINDLMDISKIEAGQMEINIEEISVNKLLDEIYNFFLPETKQKGLNFDCEKNLPASKLIMHTDKVKLYAVLMNLVKNAIKYTDEGSISFGYSKKKEVVEFFVKDSGIGIAKKNLDSVFNRFVRVHNNFANKYEGAGLGLSITKAYVELLGGKIRVKSELGKGSVFYFEIRI